ncbi:hypothetical protein B0H17DRAFT_1129405 [Mycena rosella]|uniref:Retroviral polymerase SH3-like domain-containing protein n=1 Tax=Mycena rosella TaxID=1033263 RepID=A0AAD7DUG9_MYCRO|nr:hypothetical protein B0H17DRAFT_1129405 [Mycena rosella]
MLATVLPALTAVFTLPMAMYMLGTTIADEGASQACSSDAVNNILPRLGHGESASPILIEDVCHTVPDVVELCLSIYVTISIHSGTSCPTFLDSGTSENCVVNCAHFITYQQLNIQGSTALKSGGDFEVAGKGMAEFPVHVADGDFGRQETTLAVFETWLVEVEVQTGKCCKCVHIDLGREFDNLFLGFCAKWGIRVEMIPKDSSSANRFWAEGMTTYCYICGFILLSHHPDIVPWVACFRKKDAVGSLIKLNVSHLHVWGSQCWVKDLDHVEGKLGKQGWEGTMVGYIRPQGYHIYDPKRKNIYQVQNTIFKEGNPH